jgi:hypothetical protein
MRARQWYVVPLALVLAATACSGPGAGPGTGGTEPSPPAVTGTPTDTSGPPTASPTATASPSGSDGARPTASPGSSLPPLTGPLPSFTADGIVDAAREVAGQQAGARVSTEEDIASRVASGEKLLADMAVTPAACTVIMDNSEAAVLDRAEVAAVSIPGASVATETDITLASYPAVADPAKAFASLAESVRRCADFKLTISGQDATGSVAALPADTDAQTTLAYSTTVTAGGQEATTVTVKGRDGHVIVSGTVSGMQDTDAAVEKAAAAVDAALEALRTR